MLVALGGDQLGKWLPVCIAAALPDWEFRFVGQLWTDGHHARRSGHVPRHWGWRPSRAPAFAPDRNLSDLQYRGIPWRRTGAAPRRALGELQALLTSTLREFQPNAALYLNAESAMGHLTCLAARQAGIPAVGLQTVFTPRRMLVHTSGDQWGRAVQVELDAAGPRSGGLARPDDPDLDAAASAAGQQAVALRQERRLRWTAWGERLGRTALGLPSLDEVGYGLRQLPGVRPAQAVRQLKGVQVMTAPVQGAAVLLLHRPVLGDSQTDWTDLIQFALQAIPASWPLVLRIHPDEAPLDWPAPLCTALRQRCQVWLSQPGVGPDLVDVLRPARAALTLMSSAGVHALKLGVPTLALAQAYFVGAGLAEPLDLGHPQALAQRLEQGGLPPPDPARVKRFVADIETHWTAPCPAWSPEVVPATALAEMVLSRLQEWSVAR